MNGTPQPLWVPAAFMVVAVIFYGLLGWGILQRYRWLTRSARAASERSFEGLKVHPGPAPGLVGVVFHTYSGFLVFVNQTEHRFWAPPEEARAALWRLHRFNLKRGMFAYGALLIPLLSCANYFAQKRSIRNQEEGESLLS